MNSSFEKSFGFKKRIKSKISEIKSPEILMHYLFSDTPRFSDSFLTDEMCH